MVAVRGSVVVQGEVEAEGELVALLETPWDHADVFETFFVQVLDEEPQDAFVVSADI